LSHAGINSEKGVWLSRKEETMPVSDAQKKASAKYLEKLDEVRIRMPKGKKDDIKAVAAAAGESVNQYILNAVDQRISREAAGGPTRPAEDGEVSLPSKTGKRTPTASEGLTGDNDRKVATDGT